MRMVRTRKATTNVVAGKSQRSGTGFLLIVLVGLAALPESGCSNKAGGGGSGNGVQPGQLCSTIKYYVDFDQGDDSNSGTTAETAWKHCPGDQNAEGLASTTVLQAGEGVAFRGGVKYRGNLTMQSSGSEGNPIVLAGNCWESEKGAAILEGSELLQSWNRCGSADECGGNPNWASIYYAHVPAGVNITAFTANLHEANEFLWLAQEPDLPDPFYRDEIAYFYTLPTGVMTATSLSDANLNQNAAGYQDSSVMLWVQPNIVITKEIKSFDPNTHTITYDDVGDAGVYTDRETYYSIINSMSALDQPGEYYFRPTAETDGRHKIYLWPRDSGHLNDGIEVSVRSYGINIGANSFITIDGFLVQKYSGNGLTDCGIGSVDAASIDKSQVVVSNNTIRHDAHDSGGYGGVYLSNCDYCSIENNLIEENVLTTGLFIADSDHAVARGNVIRRPGHTGIWFFTDTNGQIVNNSVSEVRGTHGNGITLYLSCNNVLVAWNTLMAAGSGFTYQDSANLYFYRNLVDAQDGLSNVNDWGGTAPGAGGTILFLNNTFVRNNRNASLNIGGITGDSYIVKNNIIDGGGSGDGIERSHNLYTGLCWDQSSSYGWSLAEGEIVQEDLSQVFTGPDSGDFHLKSGGSAIGLGTDPAAYLPVSAFPDVDLWRDLDGNPVPTGNRDVGAYVSR